MVVFNTRQIKTELQLTYKQKGRLYAHAKDKNVKDTFLAPSFLAPYLESSHIRDLMWMYCPTAVRGNELADWLALTESVVGAITM